MGAAVLWATVLLALALPPLVHGHAYLVIPPSRNAVHTSVEPINYCPHCLNGGGTHAVGARARWPQGTHAMCGDPMAQAQPREHEAGGKYAANTAPVATYTQGGAIKLAVAISTDHGGRFSYRICRYTPGTPAEERAQLTQGCLDKYRLVQAYVKGAQAPGSKYYYMGNASESGEYMRRLRHTFRLPRTLTCDGRTAKCVLQWYWQTGNSCTPPGTPKRYANAHLSICGTPEASYPEEYWNCADISILPRPVPATATAAASAPAGSQAQSPTIRRPPPPRRRPPPPKRSLPPPPPKRSPPPPPKRSPPPPPKRSPPPPTRSPPPPPIRSPPPPSSSPPPMRSPPPPSSSPPSPPPPPSPTPPSAALAGARARYADVLGLSLLFFEAQRSGKLPASNRVAWRRSAHTGDAVPGGWYDAGDYLKLNLPMAVSATFLAWGMLDFGEAYSLAGEDQHARDSLRTAADYLMACHTAEHTYVGQIGDPAIDHGYWGRPEEQTGARTSYVWTWDTPAADLLGAASSALSASSLVFQGSDPDYAARLLSHARQLYAWAAAKPGKYNAAHPIATKVYSSSRYLDKLLLAAAWLRRATGEAAFADAALAHWQAASPGGGDIYVGWDSTTVPAAILLLNLPGQAVPGASLYRSFLEYTYLPPWQEAKWGIAKTPKGLCYPSWSQWGNLRHSANAAFMQLMYARATPSCAACLTFAKAQADYMLGSSGRSFVVGYGTNPPKQPHHRSSSCPNRPAACGWSDFYSAGPNPQALVGALVGGPTGLNGDAYSDLRSDYIANEVAVDYNAGFSGLLAGLVQLL